MIVKTVGHTRPIADDVVVYMVVKMLEMVSKKEIREKELVDRKRARDRQRRY